MGLKMIRNKTKTEIQLKTKKVSLRYLDEFIKLKCASNLIQANLFPNAKEITESMGAYNTVRKYLWERFHPGDSNVICIVVGDGHTPKTGALFAYRTRWTILSIDPVMYRAKLDMGQGLYAPAGIERLTVVRDKIQSRYLGIPLETKKILFICIHSHAKLSDCIKQVKGAKACLVNIPCCIPSDLSSLPDISYEDWGIHSEKRKIEIYKDQIW